MRNKKKGNKNKWDDHYAKRARKEKHPARSVYKLEEIQKKYRLIQKGNRVLDLGCSPGSWLLYAADLVGEKGLVVGIDKKPVTVKVPSNVTIVIEDILAIQDKYITGTFHVVLSDMAPSTTGSKHVDAARSLNLCMGALEIARHHLAPGGAFVCKIFQGPDDNEFMNAVKRTFDALKIFKPKSTRKASKEIYIIGQRIKQEERLCQVIANGLQ